MDENLKDMVKRTARLAEENHKILKGMQRRARFETMWQIIKWAIIIGVTLWSYYFVQPYIEKFQEAYTGVQEASDKVRNFDLDLDLF